MTHPMVYESFDGDESYAPIAEEPDLDSVAQRYANETGMLVVHEDTRTVRLQDCECVPTTDHCSDQDGGGPCVVHEEECWVLMAFEANLPGRHDAASWLKDAEDKRLWEPADAR